MTSLKTSIKTITYLSDMGCLEIQGASLPFVLISLLLYIGAEIYRGSSQSDGIEILKSLYVVIVAFIVWCWVAACALRVSSISKKLNAYIPPANDFKSKTYDFSSILNNRYP
ncbi:hypothetical protein DV936_27480 [Klebsiella pneumoniae]|nr:hypothetical protein DV936_27480 [Klebsiella pneumoniae]